MVWSVAARTAVAVRAAFGFLFVLSCVGCVVELYRPGDEVARVQRTSSAKLAERYRYRTAFCNCRTMPVVRAQPVKTGALRTTSNVRVSKGGRSPQGVPAATKARDTQISRSAGGRDTQISRSAGGWVKFPLRSSCTRTFDKRRYLGRLVSVSV